MKKTRGIVPLLWLVVAPLLFVSAGNNFVQAKENALKDQSKEEDMSSEREQLENGGARIEYSESKVHEINGLLKDVIAHLQSADREVKVFVARKGSQRKKHYCWQVAEVVTNRETVSMSADFDSEEGPVTFAAKRVYKAGIFSEELKERGYNLYYYANGKIKMFFTRGSKEILQFYPSGKIKEFGLVDGDHKTIVEVRWNADGSLEYEKYVKPEDTEKNPSP